MTKIKISQKTLEFLHKFNVLEIILIFYFVNLLSDMWYWFENNHTELTLSSAGIYSSLVLFVAGALKFALDNIMKRYENEKNTVKEATNGDENA